jgi:hypothetical protein
VKITLILLNEKENIIGISDLEPKMNLNQSSPPDLNRAKIDFKSTLSDRLRRIKNVVT